MVAKLEAFSRKQEAEIAVSYDDEFAIKEEVTAGHGTN